MRSRGIVSDSMHSQRRARLMALQHYGKSHAPACACCGEQRLAFLAIDHIGGGGAKHRQKIGRKSITGWLKTNGFPPGFRVLCHNCNQAIGAYGVCPHEVERTGAAEPWAVLPTASDRFIAAIKKAAETLVGRGAYPSLKAVTLELGNVAASVGNLCLRRRQLHDRGEWPCEILPRGVHWRVDDGGLIDVKLIDGSVKRLVYATKEES